MTSVTNDEAAASSCVRDSSSFRSASFIAATPVRISSM